MALHKIIFDKGLIQISDPLKCNISAGQFIHKVEKSKMGRLVGSLALDMGLWPMLRAPFRTLEQYDSALNWLR